MTKLLGQSAARHCCCGGFQDEPETRFWDCDGTAQTFGSASCFVMSAVTYAVDKSRMGSILFPAARFGKSRFAERGVILEFGGRRDQFHPETRISRADDRAGVRRGLDERDCDEFGKIHGAVARVPAGCADDCHAGEPPAARARTPAESVDG
ncbi:hypothetical protein [Cereibacter changlensis]|uniref:hypothetical protein n=1 Tax=Cereibacter changlensis TaxID=402884 RepID=UPI00200B82D8|nr:hypothetical protein [Cereibacter changlensis]